MLECDVKCIEKWVNDVRKPIGGGEDGRDGRKGWGKLVPLMRIS